MLNMYDFITANATHFSQCTFGPEAEVFIDYHCPITDKQSRVWTHKNCLMFVVQGIKGYASADLVHASRAGEVLFIRKGGYVLFQHFEEPYRALVFMFGDGIIRAMAMQYPSLFSMDDRQQKQFMAQPEIQVLRSPPLIERLFCTAQSYLDQPDTESRIALELKFKELLVNLLRPKAGNAFCTYLSWLALSERWPFVKLMQDNAQLHFTVEELARTAGMSLSTFKRTFKKYFGVPAGHWLHQQRMTAAKRMLGQPGRQIAEVAFMLGYSDVPAFSRAFSRSTGSSPRVYRDKQDKDKTGFASWEG